MMNAISKDSIDSIKYAFYDKGVESNLLISIMIRNEKKILIELRLIIN